MTFQELQQVPILAGYVVIMTLILGAVFGSFLNCMAWRIVHGEKIWNGRSHCATCGHPLKAVDLVPVFSYLFLKGKCRYCGEKISPRYMVTEILSALWWLSCVLRFGLTVQTIRALAVICILFALSLVDLESYRIPNGFVIALIVVYAVTFPFIELGIGGADGSTLAAAVLMTQSADGPTAVFVAGKTGSALAALGPALLQSLGGALLLGGGLLVISLLFEKVAGKEGLGGGDIKLFFAVGLYLGPLNGLLCLIISCVIGLLLVALMRKGKIPFGPAIAIGMMICLYWGDGAVNWYLSLL